MSERATQIESFLATAGWADAEVRPLAGDASFRRYHRIRRNGCGAMLMDAPPDREDVRPFVRIARHLHGLGLSAPAILAADEAHGLLLLEDFGDDTFTRLLAAGHDEAALYRLAVDVLVHMHRLPAESAIPQGLPAYDLRRLQDETLLLTDWYMPAVLGRETASAVRDAYAVAWGEVLSPLLGTSRTLVLRDFHVDNLMGLPGRDGLSACGLLDFQDAVAGHPAYDLMSLLEDARRDVSEDVRREMLERYLGSTPAGEDADAFGAAFAILAAQRHAKVIGIFTRLYRRDGKPLYLKHIPRVWGLLERALEHPALHPVAEWFASRLPPSERRVPTPRQAAE